MIKNTHQDMSSSRPDVGLASWSPVREISDLHRMMDDFFSRAYGYTPLSTLLSGSGMQPDADVYETNDKVIVLCPLPGFEASQIEVQATDQTITISAERSPLVNHADARPFRMGYLSGATQCQATFGVPGEIDPHKIVANYRNGVLQVEAPKSERARQKSVKVNVRG